MSNEELKSLKFGDIVEIEGIYRKGEYPVISVNKASETRIVCIWDEENQVHLFIKNEFVISKKSNFKESYIVDRNSADEKYEGLQEIEAAKSIGYQLLTKGKLSRKVEQIGENKERVTLCL